MRISKSFSHVFFGPFRLTRETDFISLDKLFGTCFQPNARKNFTALIIPNLFLPSFYKCMEVLFHTFVVEASLTILKLVGQIYM